MKKLIFLLLFAGSIFGQDFIGRDFDNDLVFRETFDSEQNLRFNGGTPTDIESYNPAVFNGTSSKANYSLGLNGTYSIRIKCNLTNLNTWYQLFDVRGSNDDGSGYAYINKDDGIISSPTGTKYVNGILNATVVINTTNDIFIAGITLIEGTGTNPTSIGARWDNGQTFLGLISLVEIYKGTLSSQDVADLYSGAYTSNYPNPRSLVHIGIDSLIHTRRSITHFHTLKPTSKSEDSLVASYNMIMSTGQVLVDISGNGNNAVTFNTDQTIDGLGFDGASSVIVLDATIELNTATYNFSLLLNSFSTTPHIVSDAGTLLDYIRFETSGKIGIEAHSGGDNNIFDYTFQTNTDYDISIISSDKLWSLYVNGELQDTFSLSTSVFHLSVIGGRANTSNRQFNGTINKVKIYNRALSQTEIVEKHNESIKTVISESFSYTSLLEMDRNWSTVSGVYTIAFNVLTATTGGDLTTVVALPYVDNGYVTYDLYSGSWASVAETVDASSVFAYSNNILTMTLATNEKIRNIVIKSGVEL